MVYMRVIVANYGDCRIFYDRPFGYKRYHVEWSDGSHQIYHGIWYNEKTVREIVEANLADG